MKRAILLICIVVCNTQAQIPAPVPLPPDILHVTQRGCHIDGHEAGESLDANTGQPARFKLWTVTPFAKYANLPDGTPREEWRPLNKDGTDRYIVSYVCPKPGVCETADDVPRDAADVCSAWMKAMDRAKIKAIHDAGREVQK